MRKKFFQQVIALTLVAGLLMGLSMSAFAANNDLEEEEALKVVSTHEMREALVAEKFPTAFLDILNDSELLKYYALVINQNADIQVVRGNTGELYEDTVSPQNTIPTADMTLDIWLAMQYGPTENNRTVITSIDIYITYEWASGHPIIMGIDAIAANWDSGLFSYAPNTFISEDIHKYAGEDWKTVVETTRPAELAQGGLGYYTRLSAPSDEYSEGVKGKASFTLIPKYRVYAGGSNNSSINVTYVHNKTPIIGNISFEIVDGLNVGISLPLLSDSAADSCTFWYQQ